MRALASRVASLGLVLAGFGLVGLGLANLHTLTGGRVRAGRETSVALQAHVSPTPAGICAGLRPVVPTIVYRSVAECASAARPPATIVSAPPPAGVRSTPVPACGPDVAVATPRPAIYATPPVLSSCKAGSGYIVENGGNAPGNAGIWAWRNSWDERKPWGWVTVWAGAQVLPPGAVAPAADTSQGLVSVAVNTGLATPPPGVDVSAGLYSTPTKHGPVQIVGATGEVLKLESVRDGTTYYFDVGARQYVTGFPSVTPTPAAGAATPVSGAATAHPRASATATATAGP